jgi:hypothetical protein
MYWPEIFLGPGNTVLPALLSLAWPLPPPPPHPVRIYSLPAGLVRQIAVVCGRQQAGFLAVPARPAGPLSSHSHRHTLSHRSDRQLGEWVRWCVGAVCCDLQLILIVYRLLVRLSLKF